MPRLRFRTLLVLGFLLPSLAVARSASYTFISVEAPGASSTQPAAINQQGQITGRYFDHNGGCTGFSMR